MSKCRQEEREDIENVDSLVVVKATLLNLGKKKQVVAGLLALLDLTSHVYITLKLPHHQCQKD